MVSFRKGTPDCVSCDLTSGDENGLVLNMCENRPENISGIELTFEFPNVSLK